MLAEESRPRQWRVSRTQLSTTVLNLDKPSSSHSKSIIYQTNLTKTPYLNRRDVCECGIRLPLLRINPFRDRIFACP